MKTLIIALTCLVPFHCFAQDFDCVSMDTGLGYKTSNKTATIQTYDYKTEDVIGIERYLDIGLDSIQTSPVTIVYIYKNAYGTLLEVRRRGPVITGSFEDDENLICSMKY